MNYHWKKAPNGQYVDGHEREDVKHYCQTIFLPKITELEPNLHTWQDGVEEMVSKQSPRRKTVIWWHDKSVFYTNDRQEVYWVHENDTANLKSKGEGLSIMVSDFVSADYGWLRAPDGTSAQVILKPGKGRDGYFTNTRFLKQVNNTIAILKQFFPDEDHIFVFDNATTHLK